MRNTGDGLPVAETMTRSPRTGKKNKFTQQPCLVRELLYEANDVVIANKLLEKNRQCVNPDKILQGKRKWICSTEVVTD